MPITQTPLFPTEKTPITIKQGKTGDCYLLAAIDCIINLRPDSVNVLKKMFMEDKQGNVTVRIKRPSSPSWDPININKLNTKYQHYYDPSTNEDVIKIDRKRLHEIEKDTRGVESNCLAIKILERITSYYYVGNWGDMPGNDSIRAHNIPNRHNNTSTKFISELLKVDSYESTDLKELMQFKSMFPDYPIYVSMKYGKQDAFGAMHGRHALRIGKITDNQLTLINPWDNQKEESYSKVDIQNRNNRFCYFFDDNEGLAARLLELPYEYKSSILNSQELSSLLRDMETNGGKFSEHFLMNCASFFKEDPSLYQTYYSLNANQKSIFIDLLHQSPNKNQFLTVLSSQLSQPVKNDFNHIIKKAIEGKTKASGNHQMATAEVTDGLIKYYLYNRTNDLTRSGDLREAFIQGVFNRENIEQHVGQNVLHTKAVSNFLNTQNVFPNWWKDGAIPISNELFQSIAADLDKNNAWVFFYQLHGLSTTHPELAKNLASKLLEFFEKIYSINPKEFLEKMENNEFKKWLTSCTPDEPLQSAPKAAKENVFSYVVKNIIEEKAKVLGSHQLATTEVTDGLIKYYLYNRTNDLTRSGGLREAFIQGVFNRENIEQHVGQNVLHTKAVSNFLNAQNVFPKWWKDGAIPISNELFQSIAANLDKDNAWVCFYQLRGLSATHPELAKNLASKLLESFEKVYSSDRKQFFETIENSEFKKWVISCVPDEPNLKIIMASVNLINALAIPTQLDQTINIKNIDEIYHAVENTLETLIKDPKLIEAQFSLLGETDMRHPKIDDAYTAKIDALKKLDEIRKSKAVEIIDSYSKKINDFQVNFDNCKNKKELNVHAKKLKTEIQNIVDNKEDLNKAYSLLNIHADTPSNSIQQALKTKEVCINSAVYKESLRIQKERQEKVNSKTNLLIDNQFEHHFQILQAKRDELKIKSDHKIKGYDLAYQDAEKLCSALTKTKSDFINSEKTIEDSVVDFCKTSTKIITENIGTLDTHRGWREVAVKIVNTLAKIATFGLVKKTSFSEKTDSKEKIDNLSNSLSEIRGLR